MIIPGCEVRTKVTIIDDGIELTAGAKGIVIDIVTDTVTHKPMFVIDFFGKCIMGAFLDEIEAVKPIIRGEWV